MTNPCKGCTERAVGCHGACEDYQGYRRSLDAQNAEKSREYDVVGYCSGVKAKVRRWHRNHHRPD